MEFYTTVSVKLVSALIILLVYVQISGKGRLAPMSALDDVGNMVIGALVGGTLLNTNVTLFQAAIAVGIWSSLLLGIRYFKSQSIKARDAIDGKATRLMKDGELLIDNFKKAKITLRDFMTLVHQQGITSINELKDVWYELNGQLTIVKKGEDKISVLLVDEGKINDNQLERIDQTQEWLKEELAKQGYNDISQLFCVELYERKLWIYPYDKTPTN